MTWIRRIPRRLDFSFRRANLDWQNCASNWSLALPTSEPGAQLLGHGDLLLAAIVDRGLFVVVSADNPGSQLEGWRLLGEGLVTSGRGPSSALPALDQERRQLYLVDPTTNTPPAALLNEHSNPISAEALSKGLVLVGEYAPDGEGGFSATTTVFSRLEDEGNNGPRWTLPGSRIPALPIDDQRILAKRTEDPFDVYCLDVTSKRQLWSLPPTGGALTMLGHDGATGWLSSANKLVGFDTNSGVVTVEVSVTEMSHPHGFIDDEGILHAYNGLVYLGFDLSSDGSRVFAQRLVGDVLPRGGAAHILNRDGSLLASDEENRIFAIPGGAKAEATLIWQSNTPITGLQALGDSLFVLGADNVLTCLR